MTQSERIVGPYEDRQAVCQEYDPRAVEVAQQVAVTIRSHLPAALVEHIGSTSVPGCAGKGIVDLMLLYPDGELATAREVLDALGFQRQSTRDPFSEDRPMRTGSVTYDGTTFLLHVHVIAATSIEAETLRRFRDRLRADADLVAAYVAAKKANLASGISDSVDYCLHKGEFIQLALQGGGTPQRDAATTHEHRRLIVDQFTRQAVPFSQMPDPSPELIRAATGVRPSDTVLDVACGPGVLACSFAEVARHVTGIDLTPAMIGRAQALQQAKGLDNLRWQIGDVLPLPFPDASFSLVFTRYSFHHFLDPKSVLAEMVRVCSPGGRVAVVDVYTTSPAQAEAFNRMEMLRDPSHVRALALAELIGLFQAAGLENTTRQFYKHEFGLEAVLQGSFPNPGAADQVRQLFVDDLGVDRLGLGAHRKEGSTYFAYPVVILVGHKPPLTFGKGGVAGPSRDRRGEGRGRLGDAPASGGGLGVADRVCRGLAGDAGAVEPTAGSPAAAAPFPACPGHLPPEAGGTR
jgi:SAM-dependent methyltransferase